MNEINEFVYADTELSWKALESDGQIVEPATKSLNVDSFYFMFESEGGRGGVDDDDDDDDDDGEELIDLSSKIPYLITAEEKSEINANDIFCSSCKEQRPNEPVYPCRVCNHSYHEHCLDKMNLIRSDEERFILRQAFSNIGWSCYSCSDLTKLISTSELNELIEKFESLDADKDGRISIDEFIKIRCDEFNRQFGIDEMSSEDIKVTSVRFKLIDLDKSGFIDWDEFLNHECMRLIIHKRTGDEDVDLVRELTPKEIQRAREVFHSFDHDKSGTISEVEARRTFRNWFTFLHMKQAQLMSQDEIDIHVNVHSTLVMDRPHTNASGELNWIEYLKSQAVYILISRLNAPTGLVGCRKNNNNNNSININKNNKLEKQPH